MAATHLLMLSLGSLMLSATVGYVLWIKLRNLRFRSDILESQIRLRRAVASIGCLDNPEYLHFVSTISTFASHPDMLCWTAVFLLTPADPPQTAFEEVSNKELRKLLEIARHEFIVRAANRFLCETLGGMLLWLVTLVLPRKAAEQRVQQSVARSIEPLNDAGLFGPMHSATH